MKLLHLCLDCLHASYQIFQFHFLEPPGLLTSSLQRKSDRWLPLAPRSGCHLRKGKRKGRHGHISSCRYRNRRLLRECMILGGLWPPLAFLAPLWWGWPLLWRRTQWEGRRRSASRFRRLMKVLVWSTVRLTWEGSWRLSVLKYRGKLWSYIPLKNEIIFPHWDCFRRSGARAVISFHLLWLLFHLQTRYGVPYVHCAQEKRGPT